MLKLLLIVRQHNKKDGGKFFKATCKGKYIPLVEVEDEVYYTLRLHTPKDSTGKSSSKQLPEKEGFYEVAIPSRNDIWLDTRSEFVDKNIVHVRVSKMIFAGAIAKREIEK